MPLDAIRYIRPGKREDREHRRGRSPLSAESIFLIYRRQLFFDIAPYREHRHVWLTAHVLNLNVAVHHRY